MYLRGLCLAGRKKELQDRGQFFVMLLCPPRRTSAPLATTTKCTTSQSPPMPSGGSATPISEPADYIPGIWC